MASIFDTTKSIYDILAEKRAQLEQQSPDVAAQLPAIGANTPGQRMFASDEAAKDQSLADAVQGIVQPISQAAAGPMAKPKEQAQTAGGINEVLDYLNPLKPKQTYGPNIGSALGMGENAGGILGTGIQPIDALAFALGMAITRNMPQDQAIKTTMGFAQLPGQFRESQEKAARSFIDDKINAINAELSQGNLAMRQVENVQKIQEARRKQNLIGAVTERLATGVPLGDVEKQVIAAQAHGVLDPNVIKELILAPDLASQLATLEKVSGYAQRYNLGSVSGTLDLPGGAKVTIGGGRGSGRPVTTGELIDAQQTGTISDRLKEVGYSSAEQVNSGIQARQRLEKERISITLANSDRAQKTLELLRGDERKELKGLSEIHRNGTELAKLYESALQSHKGAFPTDVNLAIAGATRAPDTWIGASIQALSQRHPGLTKQDLDFVAKFATMQKFARESLNDVGNLSNFERGVFQTMLGTPVDRPDLFRARLRNLVRDAEISYNLTYSTLSGTRGMGEFGPSLQVTPPNQQGQPKATHRYNPSTGQVEVIK